MGISKLNKKGMQLKSLFFAVVAASMMIIAIGVHVGEWGTKYNSGITDDLQEYEALDEFSTEAQNQKSSITPQDADPGTGDLEGKTFRGGYGILGRIFLPFNTVFNMVESIEKRFALPSYVGEGVLAMMFFSLIFTIIAIIFRLSRTTA